MFVTVIYGMVGWYLADRQVRHYFENGAWSLSGVALAGVFSRAHRCTSSMPRPVVTALCLSSTSSAFPPRCIFSGSSSRSTMTSCRTGIVAPWLAQPPRQRASHLGATGTGRGNNDNVPIRKAAGILTTAPPSATAGTSISLIHRYGIRSRSSLRRRRREWSTFDATAYLADKDGAEPFPLFRGHAGSSVI